MLTSVLKAFFRQSCSTVPATTLCSLALFTASTQYVDAEIALGSPDIIEISVQHLPEVKEQLSQGLGISWGKEHKSVEHVKVGDEVQHVELTRVYSVSSEPYIELIKASPQIGPWAPFYEPQNGSRPRSSMVWRLSKDDYKKAKHQMSEAGLPRTAKGSDFAYYQAFNGVQLEIVRNDVAPNPKDGKPNTPPVGKIDFGPLYYLNIPQRPSPVLPNLNIPVDDFILRHQIANATGQGIKWDIGLPFPTPIPYLVGTDTANPVLLSNPIGVFSCNPKPYISTVVINPSIPPFGATENSTTFSHAWLVPGSGIDPAGAQVMANYENQLLAAGFQPVIRLDAQSLGIVPYRADILSYFIGIDNIDVQLVNNITAVVPSVSCIEQCGECTGGE